MPLPALAVALGKKLLVNKAASALKRNKPTTTKKKKKKKATGGQLAQGAQAPQGGRSTFGRKDSVFTPNIKKKPLKRTLTSKQHTLPEHIKSAIKAAPTKRYCGGKSKAFKRKKY